MLSLRLPNVFEYMIPFKPVNVPNYAKMMYLFFDEDLNVDSVGETTAYLSLSLTELGANPFSPVANS